MHGGWDLDATFDSEGGLSQRRLCFIISSRRSDFGDLLSVQHKHPTAPAVRYAVTGN